MEFEPKDSRDRIRLALVVIGLVVFSFAVIAALAYVFAGFIAPWVGQNLASQLTPKKQLAVLAVLGTVLSMMLLGVLRRVWLRTMTRYGYEVLALRLSNGRKSRYDGDAD